MGKIFLNPHPPHSCRNLPTSSVIGTFTITVELVLSTPPPLHFFGLLTRGGGEGDGAKIVCSRGVLKIQEIQVLNSALNQGGGGLMRG